MSITKQERCKRRRRRWVKRALVCSAVLPLFMPSVVALRLSSNTLSFVPASSPCIRRENRLYSILSEEETRQVQVSFPKEQLIQSSSEIHSDGSSPKLVEVETFNGTPLVYNGYSKFNGVPQPANGKQPPPVTPESNGKTQPTTLRKLWRRRHARSIEEGVRREKTREKTSQLYNLLSKAAPLPTPRKRRYFARTISGLIHALAEEADGVEVAVKAQEDSPLWRKRVDKIRINFSRLGFKPLRMGGTLDEILENLEEQISQNSRQELAENLELSAVSCADEAFDRIDEDKSGALDPEEIAKALTAAAPSNDSDAEVFEGLASQLVELYDSNGDGVVDREEYQRLVADMAKLRQEEQDKQEKRREQEENPGFGLRRLYARTFGALWRQKEEVSEVIRDVVDGGSTQFHVADDPPKTRIGTSSAPDGMVNISDDAAVDSVAKGGGSIVLSDLKLDLRQLLFGCVPVVKKITPGGPLVLEPFTATVTASFTRDDIKASFLLDAGLRRLVARALRRRVRSFRDLVDGAVFYGRSWNMASKSAPLVEVPELTSVEFDKENRIMMTGIAQVRTSPDAPFIENAFKVRTKLGTRRDGQCIRLVEPELAFVLECPKQWEKNILFSLKKLGIVKPVRPKPLYSFFPIYSPFKVDDNDGFDLGEDNRIKSIGIKDGALQFELSAVLRPGRFLGNHYLAFTIPQRTFIITMDRVKEGMRAARRNKRAALAAAREVQVSERKLKGRNYLDVVAQSLSSQELVRDHEELKLAPPPKKQKPQGNKSFFSRFVDGYLGAGKDENEDHERLTIAISDWFGRQGTASNETAAAGAT